MLADVDQTGLEFVDVAAQALDAAGYLELEAVDTVALEHADFVEQGLAEELPDTAGGDLGLVPAGTAAAVGDLGLVLAGTAAAVVELEDDTDNQDQDVVGTAVAVHEEQRQDVPQEVVPRKMIKRD